MMLKSAQKLRCFFVLLGVLLTLTTCAQIQKKKVTIPAGKESVTISGSVKGYQTTDYLVDLKAGQKLSVKMTTKNGANYFNLIAPNAGDVAYFIGETNGNDYSGQVKETGTHTIRVFLLRSAARRNETANFKIVVTAAAKM